VSKKALIMIDLQNDFCSEGSLAVNGAEEAVLLANQLQPFFDLIIATQDWHPEEHHSFVDLWPVHCVQNTTGAALHDHLNQVRIDKIFYKGMHEKVDSYSAFFDNEHLYATGLGGYLQSKKVTEVYLLGLATDYCVKYSCLDALQLGFKVYVIADACRAVELNVGDSEQALREMEAAGAIIISSSQIMQASS